MCRQLETNQVQLVFIFYFTFHPKWWIIIEGKDGPTVDAVKLSGNGPEHLLSFARRMMKRKREGKVETS